MKTKLLIIMLLIGSSVEITQIPESFFEELDSQNMAQIKWFGLGTNSEIQVYQIQVTDKDMDETFSRQSLQTGETISELGGFTSLIVGSLGPILIMFFIVFYAIKKIRAKKYIEK